MFTKLAVFLSLIAINLLVNLCLGVEIYGDIYPNTRADLQIYYKMPNRDNKCYKDVPSVLYQTKENVTVHGNASTPEFFRLEVCCEGYKRAYNRGNQCEPDCSKISPDNCRHGFCRSPYNCECYEGFVKNTEGKCVHTCPVGCDNGRCLLDGTCICKPGYSLDPETRKFCIPDCSHIPCGLNQRCRAPGQCGCAQGYEVLEQLGCQPICQPHCGFGRCVAPGECECFPGYVKRLGRSICEAECLSMCENGFCESRYKCQCHVGFYYEPSIQSCLPACPEACEHGMCIAPGVCRCFEGYYLRDNTCEPICEGGCGPYGHCVAPNVCACGPGHQLCLGDGKCSSMGKCYCPPGMSHYIDRCINSDVLSNTTYTNTDEIFPINDGFRREFQILIGRFFEYSNFGFKPYFK